MLLYTTVLHVTTDAQKMFKRYTFIIESFSVFTRKKRTIETAAVSRLSLPAACKFEEIKW